MPACSPDGWVQKPAGLGRQGPTRQVRGLSRLALPQLVHVASVWLTEPGLERTRDFVEKGEVYRDSEGNLVPACRIVFERSSALLNSADLTLSFRWFRFARGWRR